MESIELMPARVKVAAILRKSILSGEFAEGEELSLTTVANNLGISRTPVREAFQTLESEGLITLRMNKGAIVRGINQEMIVDHFEMRMLLEGEAVVRAAKNRMETEPLLLVQQELLAQGAQLEMQEYAEQNQSFHIAIWKAAGNQKLYSYLMGLWNGPSIGRNTNAPSHRALSIKEHVDILGCIQRQEYEKGREIMQYHVRRSMDNILSSYLMGDLTPFEEALNQQNNVG